jgi:hypothetical protein
MLTFDSSPLTKSKRFIDVQSLRALKIKDGKIKMEN